MHLMRQRTNPGAGNTSDDPPRARWRRSWNAIRVPTVIDVMKYDDENVKEHILGRQRLTAGDMEGVGEKARRIFESS